MFNSKIKALGIGVLAVTAGFAGAGMYETFRTEKSLPAETVQGGVGSPVTFVSDGPDYAPTDFVAASESSVPAVVHVKTTFGSATSYGAQGYNPFRDFFWGNPGYQNQQPSMGAGSGVILTDDGYIVTNNHVVDNATKVEVTLNDKRSFEAKVIGTDPSTDLALLKVEEKGLPFIQYGNSDEVRVGEWVLAVGNPFNLTSTVTAGIVSAKARNIHILPDQQFPIESFIQTDAAVNPGNSGGALVNTSGRLIGINTAIASNTGAYSGYSFAVPVSIVRKVVDDLLEYGHVQRAFIGVSIRDVDSELAKEKYLSTMKGVYVNGISEGGAAQDAGIKEGDVITHVGAVAVSSTPELQEQVSRHRPGDKISVTVLRGDSRKNISVTLKNKNGNTEIVKNEAISLLGADLEPVSKELAAKLSISGGVQVKKLNAGKLRSAGIREGFIIQSIDNKDVFTTDDISSLLNNKSGGVLMEGIYPNGVRAYYGFGL
jgi:Do/DeqQ family serine protease